MAKTTLKQKASIATEKLYALAEKYSKTDDLKGLLEDLAKNFSFDNPNPKSILNRLGPYVIRTGKALVFPSLASSGQKSIKWSSKGLTLSKNAVPAHLYQKAIDGSICYDVSMQEDLSIILKPIKTS